MSFSPFDRIGNTAEKRRKCLLPAFSPFPTVFSKAGLLLSQDGVVKGKSLFPLTHSHTMTPFDAPGKQAF